MSCEKCWRDANARHFCTQSESVTFEYHRFLKEREDNPCTPEEQCGELHSLIHYADGTIHCACGIKEGKVLP